MNLTAMPDGRAARYSQAVAYADRRNGEGKNTPMVPAVAARVPDGVCASRGAMAQLRPADASQRNSSGSVPINRPIDNPDQLAAPAADADHRQADYFLRLLIHDCRRIDDKIVQYQKAIAVAERRSAIDHVHRIRRMLRVEEQELQTLYRLIDRLRRRFPFPLDTKVTGETKIKTMNS